MQKQSSRVHVYCRVSTSGQEDNHSLDTQEDACRTWAAKHALPVASITREVGSGSDRKRPQLDALIATLLPGDVVLAYALDRFSRRQIDTAVLVDAIEAAGAALELVTEDFEQTATGIFLRGAKAFAAELEHEKIAERTQRGRRQRLATGKPLPSFKPPYGYLWVDPESRQKTKLMLDPATAPTVRLIYDLALARTPIRAIIRELEARGIPSPTGKPRWAYPVIRDLLTKSVYTGTASAFAKRADRKRDGSGYTIRAGRSDEIVLVPDIAPAIVTPEEQARVRANFEHNKAAAARNNRQPAATLLRAGFVTCGHCGRACSVVNQSKARAGTSPYYRCGSRVEGKSACPVPTIAASVIDGPVWQCVADVLRDPAIIEREVARRRRDGSLDRELASLDKQIDALADKQARMARRIAQIEDDDVAAPLIAQLKALATQKTTAQQQRDDLVQRVADRAAETTRVQSLAAWCSRVGANLDRMSYDEKRLALDALGVKVRIYRKDTLDDDGQPHPRWQITMRPMAPTSAIVNVQTCLADQNRLPVVTLSWSSDDLVPAEAA